MIGKSILHYRILKELGRGGMGIVYLAEDSKLNRRVAIKFLPPHITVNNSDRERFKIEAQAAAALSHPNIATIHAIEEEGDEIFIVMEYIDGLELKSIINNQLSINNVIDYAIQIAKGLHTAHKKGIIHRDIKSSNIMVTEDGSVKIMDFGLAKIGEGMQLTKSQTTLGTVAYMSPEQAQGETADAQSDIWSFGVVLYEMLTGKLPFKGSHEPAIIYAIINEQPNLDLIEDESLKTVVSKCLQKDKSERYLSIPQILEDLQVERNSSTSIKQVNLKRDTTKNIVYNKPFITVLGIAFIVTVYFIFFYSDEPADHPEMKTIRFTSFPGLELFPAISPDGRTVAFSWTGSQEDNFDIYIQRIDGGNPLRLTTDPHFDGRPSWSSDGSKIAFLRFTYRNPEIPSKEIIVVPSLGGGERKIIEFYPGKSEWPSISWSDDNRYIYYPSWSKTDSGFVIYKVSLEKQETVQITHLPAGVWGDQSPKISPDGESLAFLRGNPDKFDIFVKNLSDNNVQQLTAVNTSINGYSWGEDGSYIIFSANLDGTSALWKVKFSNNKPDKILSGFDIGNPDFSATGNVLVYNETITNSNIWKIDLLDTTKNSPLIISSFNNIPADISPDGNKILFISDRTGMANIWMSDSNGSNQSQLTYFEKKTLSASAQYSASGKEILVRFLQEYNLLRANGSNLRKLEGDNMGFHAVWAENDSGFYASPYPENKLYFFSKDGHKKRQITMKEGISPQLCGKYIYYIKNWDNYDIWRVPFTGGEEEPVLREMLNFSFRSWRVVEKGIYFVRADTSGYVLDFYDFKSKQIKRIKKRFSPSNIVIDPDAKYLLYSKWEPVKSDIVLVKNFDPSEGL